MPQLGIYHIQNPKDSNDFVGGVSGAEGERALQVVAQDMHVTRPVAILSHVAV